MEDEILVVFAEENFEVGKFEEGNLDVGILEENLEGVPEEEVFPTTGRLIGRIFFQRYQTTLQFEINDLLL